MFTYLCTKVIWQYFDNIGDLKWVPADIVGKAAQENHGQNTLSYMRIAFTISSNLLIICSLESCPDCSTLRLKYCFNECEGWLTYESDKQSTCRSQEKRAPLKLVDHKSKS